MDISPENQAYIIALLVAVSVLAAAFSLFGKRIKSRETKTSRVQVVSGIAKNKIIPGSENTEQSVLRRKAVQKQLKNLEEQQQAKKQKISMQMRIDRAGLTISARALIMAGLGLGIVIGGGLFIAGYSPYLAAAASIAIGLGMPKWVVSFLGKRRIAKFSSEFVNAIDIIVRGIKSGLPVNDCLQIIAKETASPVREEFTTIVSGQKVGVTLTQSLERLYLRIPTSEVNFFSIVIGIQQQTGGNLAEALGNLSTVLRERKKMKGKVQAMSSEAKSSAMIIGSLPFLVMLMLYLTTPSYLDPLFEERTGNLMLLGGGMWMSMGVLTMRKMINFQI